MAVRATFQPHFYGNHLAPIQTIRSFSITRAGNDRPPIHRHHPLAPESDKAATRPAEP